MAQLEFYINSVRLSLLFNITIFHFKYLKASNFVGGPVLIQYLLICSISKVAVHQAAVRRLPVQLLQIRVSSQFKLACLLLQYHSGVILFLYVNELPGILVTTISNY